MNKLGGRMDDVAFTLIGDTSKPSCIKLVEEIIKSLRMHRVHKPVLYKYPVNKKGGYGFTFICPITESFVAVDSWPEWKGVYLKIMSCRTVNLNIIKKKIRKLKYKIGEIRANELSLKRSLEDGIFQ